MDFNKRIRILRLQRNWSQQYVADGIGVTQRAIGYWESGERTPNVRDFAALAVLFDVTMDELFWGN